MEIAWPTFSIVQLSKRMSSTTPPRPRRLFKWMPFTVSRTVMLLATTLRTPPEVSLDRKSTRLNSSHANISYAVFCLNKQCQVDLAFPVWLGELQIQKGTL